MIPIAPYNNQPITAIKPIQTGSTQAYIQKIPPNADNGEFLKIFYNALQNTATHPNNSQSMAVSEHNGSSNANVTQNFFSLLGDSYQKLLIRNDEGIAGNFTSFLKDSKKQNSPFSTPSDIRRAISAYERNSMFSGLSEHTQDFFA